MIKPKDSELEEVEKFAYALMPIADICVILEWDIALYSPLFSTEGHCVATAYKKGCLQLKYELNLENIKFAKQGNGSAMVAVQKQISELELAELKNINK